MISIPVSIRDFPVYALRMMATIRAGLLRGGCRRSRAARHGLPLGLERPPAGLAAPWDAARIKAMRKFCDDRSFDVSYYPGIDVVALKANIYNDLPAISFAKGEVESSDTADDSIADEAVAVMNGQPTDSAQEFDLRPATLDRPMFFDILRLDHLGTILKRLEILPQQELGPLINIAVLAQALVIAARRSCCCRWRHRAGSAPRARRLAGRCSISPRSASAISSSKSRSSARRASISMTSPPPSRWY